MLRFVEGGYDFLGRDLDGTLRSTLEYRYDHLGNPTHVQGMTRGDARFFPMVRGGNPNRLSIVDDPHAALRQRARLGANAPDYVLSSFMGGRYTDPVYGAGILSRTTEVRIPRPHRTDWDVGLRAAYDVRYEQMASIVRGLGPAVRR